MPFELRWTNRGREDFDAIKVRAQKAFQSRKSAGKTKASKQEGLFGQVTKCLGNLAENPKHPSLNTHEHGSLPHPYADGEKVFEAYVQNKTPGAYRVYWCYGPAKGEITILAITPHP